MRLFSDFWLFSVAQSPYVDSRVLLELFLFLDNYLTVGLCGRTESGVSVKVLITALGFPGYRKEAKA